MESILQSLKGIGTLRLSLMAAVSILLIGFFAYLTIHMSAGVMAPLYNNLPIEDGSKIIAELDKQGIKYQLRANGTQILVPADDVLRLRLQMAGQGLPSKGSIVGYEIFDNSEALGTSNFVQNVNLVRALEGELGRTIGALDVIENARVHLVLPKRELFSKERDEASASVILKLKNRSSVLNAEQIKAIAHLVATAVPGLKPGRITIVDSNGKLLSKGADDPNDPSTIASSTEEFKINYENHMRQTIENLLSSSLGDGKVKVQVSADIDFDRITTNSETFDPESKVERSVQTSEEKEKSRDQEKADVSVATNLPDNKSKEPAAASSSDAQKTQETTNYEISKVTKNHIKETGTVNRISVAVLVDGTYAQATENKKIVKTYVPRTPDELKQIDSLVKSAIGFNEKRGDSVDVVNMQFNLDLETPEEKPLDWIKHDIDSILKTVVIGVVAVMVILLVIRPLVNRAFEITPAEFDENGNPVMPSGMAGGDAVMSVPGMDMEETAEGMMSKSGSTSMKRLNDIASSNPEETIAALRTWMIQKN